jgi:hypothetical protein
MSDKGNGGGKKPDAGKKEPAKGKDKGKDKGKGKGKGDGGKK